MNISNCILKVNAMTSKLAAATKSNHELRNEIKALAPWHLLVNVNGELNTELETLKAAG